MLYKHILMTYVIHCYYNTMSLSALTLVSNTVAIQCACYCDVHPQPVFFYIIVCF